MNKRKTSPRRRVCRRLDSVVLRLYRAAKDLSDSCGDNYGSESADNGEYERYYSDKAKDTLDKVLTEIETQNKYARQNLFKVVHFVNRDGKVCNKKEATIMIATNVDGLTLPFIIDIAEKIKLKVGSRFIEHMDYIKV